LAKCVSIWVSAANGVLGEASPQAALSALQAHLSDFKVAGQAKTIDDIPPKN